MNPVQKSMSKQFGAWLFETLSGMVNVSALRSMRVPNIVTSQSSQKSQNILMNQNSRKVIKNRETHSEKWSRRSRSLNSIENKDRGQDVSEFVQNELTDHKFAASNTQRIMPSEWNATQTKGIHVHVESTREFSHTTKWQQKGNDVTRRQQRHSQSCMHVEGKRCTVGNLPDAVTRVGKCETWGAKPQRLVSMRIREKTQQEE